MRRLAAFIAVAQLAITAAAAPGADPQPRLSLAKSELNSNASLVEDIIGQPFEIAVQAAAPEYGKQKMQWPLPDAFKRQATCVNYCGVSQSAPRTYCGCGLTCCPNGRCCSSAAGEICCGTLCCTNGASCVSNSCMARTLVLSLTATITSVSIRETTSLVTATSGTVTLTTTLSSVTVVTISSADIATSFVTITSTRSGAKRARGVHDSRPANTPDLPIATPTPSAMKGEGYPLSKTDARSPNITPFPSVQQLNEDVELRKRQNLAVTTITSIVATTTVSSVSIRTVFSTLSARATITSSTTIWQTVTSVINARSTRIATTTLFLTPNVITVNGGGLTTEFVSNAGPSGNPGGATTSGGSSGTGAGQDSNAGAQGGSGGLSTGAKIGIGAGAGGGGLLIALLVGAFFFFRRRKSKKEENQEMIQSAVDSAMAAHTARQSVSNIPPVSYYDQKHMSTSSYSAPSPHAASPSPPIHAPQPGYVYPPPPGHGQPVYNTDPLNFSEAMGSDLRFNYSAPLYGTEMAGSPVQQRYELANVQSPAPQQHPILYSDLPEVRR